MERYICIHGHFYQPPRENPWLEEIELQESAFPYHDWNERVTAECYARNGASRILGERDQIVEIVNNYANISFNFGPTLLAWMEPKAPDVYQAIIDADSESQRAFSGHGSAIAQPYNHIIMPLASRQDKYTQVLWGIMDFEHRFGRRPEGMWLPETAVDLETLETLTELGIVFTILAPHQAGRVRPIGSRTRKEVGDGRLDPTMPYVCRLPSGNKINLFFYDGPISRAVAFESLLGKGENFAHRLIGAFAKSPDRPQLVHIATDGETYGHHHRFGEMGLSYALHYLQANKLARLTNYGEFLERHPPTHEVEILENTSWSCSHGVERWRGDCGCNTGANQVWTQAWRAPLRKSIDWLRDALLPLFTGKAGTMVKDPLRARDDYIEVILSRTPESLKGFLGRHARRTLTPQETTEVLKLLELQRHAMLMQTSCGWFFDDLSGIETVQVLQYAGRCIQLAQELGGDGLEARFLEKLEKAKSNVPDRGNGRQIYQELVIPAMVNLVKVGAHYAITSLFKDYPDQVDIGGYRTTRKHYKTFEAGKVRLAVGRAHVTSVITQESADLCFGVLHLGDHNINCGVHGFEGEESYKTLMKVISEPFTKADFPKVLRVMDKHFGDSTYSLRSLFKDEQRTVLDLILQSALDEAAALYGQVYENNAPLLRFIKDLGIPPPKALYANAEFVLNSHLRQALESDELDVERIGGLLKEASMEGVSLEVDSLEYALRRNMERMADALSDSPRDLARLTRLEAASGLLETMPFAVNTWKIQNIYFELLRTLYPETRARADEGDESAKKWLGHFSSMGKNLSVRVD